MNRERKIDKERERKREGEREREKELEGEIEEIEIKKREEGPPLHPLLFSNVIDS